MAALNFDALPLAANLAVFAAAAAVVWLSGTRLATYADQVHARTGLAQALVGMLLLGAATSLPELTTTISGSVIGNAALVTGNLFGGVAMQITVLAVVDAIAVRQALTYVTPRPILLFQGVMLILMLSVAMSGALLGEPVSIFGIGLTPLLLVILYAVAVRVASGQKYLPRWRPVGKPPEGEAPSETPRSQTSSAGLALRIAVGAVLILISGTVLTLSADALAEQTGLGASFVGVALLAASTSLPELSTTIQSVRLGNVEMAVSNILGTNLLEVALFAVADVAYRDGPILAVADRSGMFAGAIGLVLTCVLLLGLLERRDRTVARMGLDSVAMLVIYGVGLVGLYHLR